MKPVFICFVLMALAGNLESARILGLFSCPIRSHFTMFEGVMKALAVRGHQVTVYSHYPQERPIPNYKDVSLIGSLPNFVEEFSLSEALDNSDTYNTLNLLRTLSYEECEILEFPAMQALINSNETYDLVFTEAFIADCMLPFVHKFQAPGIALRSSAVMPWTADRFGLPDNPSYIPIEFGITSDHMGFSERLWNAIFLALSKFYYRKYVDEPSDSVMKKYFGNSLPPLREIAKNTSMLFVNTNPALNPPRPLVPAVVEIGGIHLKPGGKLPKDILSFMDEAEHGVIYFTFGSIAKTEELPGEKLKAVLEAFAELPQRVIWKWGADNLPGQPPNVLVRKWLPQYEILCHPKMRLFITHGGLLGSIEAVTNGVPLLGIPLFGDQPVNVKMFVRRGIGLHLSLRELSKKTLLDAVHTILNDAGYKERAEKVSLAFRDIQMTPQEAVVYWSEYVIRHKGARHLRSAAVDLQWYQILLLDVIAAILFGFLVVLATGIFLLRVILRWICRPRSAATIPSPHRKANKDKQQ